MRDSSPIGRLIASKHPVSRVHLRGHLLTFISWVLITATAAILTPSEAGHGTHQQLGLPPCGSVALFHRPCPGCGLTTSFTATVHGRFLEAFHAHWLGPLIYLGYTVVALLGGYGWLTKTYFDTSGPGIGRFLKIFVVVFLVYGVTRFALVRVYPEVEPLVWHR